MSDAPADARLASAYEPREVEDRIYAFWERGGWFRAEPGPGREPYCIIMPPPNVTGELHLGHGLEDAITDALVRWRRMQGRAALWLPGEDHAGIATQNVMERELAREGVDRRDIGREVFVERTWQWVRRLRPRIAEQHRKLGASADWSRDAFTLDPGIVRAVRTTFVNLYRDGLIYRGLRMINWCPRCGTALSDLEVDYVEEEASLWYVRYPVVGEGGMALPEAVTVATVRPETMVADTGVAVHPDDERYEDRIGRTVLLPIVGRELPVVADEAIRPEFGTGALKVTPGHDPLDWDIGQRHDLEAIVAIARDGRMSEEAGPYAGMTVEEARAAIVRDLADGGFLEREEPYTHSVGRCSRCEAVIEPLPGEQWWVAVNREYAPGLTLAGAAGAAVREGRIRVVPPRLARTFLNWTDSMRDWCISRQLWWGHQIPVWYCDCGETIVQVDDPAACPVCGTTALRQDEDVLDTWFSSALAPHADLGWPDDADGDLRAFYPTTDMQMGYDIMFFWCARMVMFGLYNMRAHAPDGDVPFRTVLFHGLIRDANGEKMTKSRGNVVDPLVAAGAYGADAFRFALLTASTLGQDMKYSEERMASARNFANKVWNTARYALLRLEGRRVAPPRPDDREGLALEDRWLLSRLAALEGETDSLLTAYQLGEAARRVHDFLWNELADWYVEMSKPRLQAGDERPLATLAYALDRGLRLLHPVMPFVTEELWGRLRAHLDDGDGAEALIVAPWPRPDERWRDEAAEAALAHVIEVNRAIRNLRAEKGVPAGERPAVRLRADEHAGALRETAAATAFTSRVEPLVTGADEPLPAGDHAFARVGGTEVALALPQVDEAAERERLARELDETAERIARLERQLANGRFLERAPAEVVRGERERLAAAEARAEGLRERLAALGR